MNVNELATLLQEFYRDKLAARQRHADSALVVTNYDFNNTYQYILAREDVHLNWVRDALSAFGVTVDDVPAGAARDAGTRDRESGRRHRDRDAQSSAVSGDRDAAQAFVDKWQPRLASIPNARHRNMLRVIVGETLEHKRFFEQALAGRTDLLGRRADGAGTAGEVLPTRWVE